MNLFYYTEVKEDKTITGYSFCLDDVIMTYPNEGALNVVLSMGSDKLNPIEYKYKLDPKTKEKVPVKVAKFEITNEPIVVELKVKEEINKFFEMTGGPKWED
jgi:hypothetical protein